MHDVELGQKVMEEVVHNGCILGHNKDNFLVFTRAFLTYAVNFFKGRFIAKKVSCLCTLCI